MSSARDAKRFLGLVTLSLWFCLALAPMRCAAAALGTLSAKFPLAANHLALDPVRPRMYATMTGSNCVAVIDTSTLKVLEIIPIGSSPVSMAVSPDGSRLYVANEGSTVNAIGVIDLTTLEVLPSLSTQTPLSDVAVGLGGSIYAVEDADSLATASILQISATGALQSMFGTGLNNAGGYLAISPDQATLYYAAISSTPGSLASFDISSGSGTQLQINNTVFSDCADLEISHSGAFLSFVTAGGQGNGVFEIPSNNFAGSNGTFNTGFDPLDIAFSPDDALAYTETFGKKQINVFDTNTFALTGSFNLSGDTSRLKTDSSGKYLFATVLALTTSGDPYEVPVSINVYDTGRAAAVITSGTAQTTQAGSAFSYQITATNGPASYNATGLPPGLSVDNATGSISGTATSAGYWQAVVSASNAIGVAMTNLVITAGSPPTAALTVSVSGSGAVTGGYAGTTNRVVGSSISVLATAAPGSVFTGWTGDITTTANPLSFILESATSVRANFAPATLGTLRAAFNLPASYFAVDPVRPRIYATLSGSNSVAVIDTSTLTLVQVIPIGTNPEGLAVSPDGSRLYVANAGSIQNQTGNGVGVIDLTTLTVLPSLATPAAPSDVAVGLNGQLYLAPQEYYTLNLMQISTDGQTGSVFNCGVDISGGYLQMSPDQKTLYFGSTNPGTVASFDVSSGSAVLLQNNSSTAGEGGSDLAISHSGAFLAYANGGFGQPDLGIAGIPVNNLFAYNGSFEAGNTPLCVAFSPDDAAAYVMPHSTNEILVFDTSTFALTGTFPTPGDANRVITDSSGKYLFAATQDSSFVPVAVNVYDTGRNAAVITSGTARTTLTGAAFSYQITAANSPASYGATGLPAGLSVDPSSGLISGSATAAGVSRVVISASNAIGVAMANLSITTLDSASNTELTVSVNGSGTVTGGLLGATFPAIGSAISISATPAAGNMFEGWTGDITSAANPLDFDIESATSIEANFAPVGPTVTSGTQTGLDYGAPFSYQIMASGSGPLTYSASGLPAGLSVDPDTGLISGTLGDAGNFAVVLTASNAGGTYGTGNLSLEVEALLTVTAGVGGFTEPSGSSYLSLGSGVTLESIPTQGYLFQEWTGPSLSTSNPLDFAMPATAQWMANFEPSSTYEGTYTGLFAASSPADASSGLLGITLGANGKFTGEFLIGGTKYSIKGTFDPSDTANITIPRRGPPPISLALTLNLSGATPVVTGSAGDGTWTSAVSTDYSPVFTKADPSARAGAYTVALYSSTGNQMAPAGTGYASLNVKDTGVASVVGLLGDGTAFSSAATLGADGTLTVYCPLYARKGAIAGTIIFETGANAGFLTGTLNWWRPAGASKGPYEGGFTTTLGVAGSSYNAANGLPGTNGTLGFAGGALITPASQPFTLNADHQLVITKPSALSATFSLSPKTGVFSGKFLDGGKKEAYRGVILQAQDTMAGFFLDPAGSGPVDATVAP